MNEIYEAYLAHYGVKGQKHGRRRYQNEDGSLTPEGREHYGVGDGHRDVPESDTWKKKESKYLSDEELNRRNNRMQREAQYRMSIDNRHPVKKEAVSAAKKILLYTAIGSTSALMTKNYKTIASKGADFIKRVGASRALRRGVGRGAKWLI